MTLRPITEKYMKYSERKLNKNPTDRVSHLENPPLGLETRILFWHHWIPCTWKHGCRHQNHVPMWNRNEVMLDNVKFSIPLAAILKTAVLGEFQGEKNLAPSSFPFYRHNLINKNNKITLDSQVLRELLSWQVIPHYFVCVNTGRTHLYKETSENTVSCF